MADKRTFAREIALLTRGFATVHKIDRSILPFYTFKNLVDVALPYIALYASSLIITGLTSGAEVSTLIIFAAICVSATFALKLLLMFLGRATDIKRETYVSRAKIFLNNVDMTNMYAYCEDREARLLSQRARFFDGLLGLPTFFADFIKTAINFAVAFTLSLRIFFAAGKGGGGPLEALIGSPFSALLITTVIALSIAVNYLTRKRNNDRRYDFM